ncbi:MAG: hypothetical protein AABX88_02805 [Nanoarchaeota archaeon]
MIRKVSPDKEKALSIIKTAESDMRFTLTLKISEDSANTIVRNIYESFRMLGEALLINKGIKIMDHVESINELLKLDVDTNRPIYLIENLRKLRHNINYYGYKANISEVENAVSVAKSCFKPLLDKTMEMVRGK